MDLQAFLNTLPDIANRFPADTLFQIVVAWILFQHWNSKFENEKVGNAGSDGKKPIRWIHSIKLKKACRIAKYPASLFYAHRDQRNFDGLLTGRSPATVQL